MRASYHADTYYRVYYDRVNLFARAAENSDGTCIRGARYSITGRMDIDVHDP